MIRLVFAILLAVATPAVAQSTPPGMIPITPPTPPGLTPVTPPSSLGQSAPTMQMVPVPGGGLVPVLPGPSGRNNFSDRIQNCVQGGAAAGIGPNGMGQFSARCAN